MEHRVGLLGIPRLLVETVAWTFTAAGIAVAVVFVGLRARRRNQPS